MRFDNLPDWLEWIETLHPRSMELGLDRVRRVFDALTLDFTDTPVITVAGTNGKGSCVALVGSVLTEAGYRVGSYTSPHLLRYNERVCLDGEPVDDESLCRAFEAVDRARGEVSLTYFEFGTLAAMHLFRENGCDVLLLEVGLGGRLDAVNVVAPDIAVITSVALDHMSWLGDEREQIGREKAGILREGIRVVFGESEPPQSVLAEAERLRCEGYLPERDFAITGEEEAGWSWRGTGFDGRPVALDGLPRPRLSIRNAACALQVVACLNEGIEEEAIRRGLEKARFPGRCQHVDVDGVDVVLDVAHNPAAVKHLVDHLDSLAQTERTVALFAVMRDKDVDGIIEAAGDRFTAWFLADLRGNDRALPASELGRVVHAHGINMISVSKNMRQAWRRVLSLLERGHRLVVFGSFFTVAEVMAIIERDSQRSAREKAE